MKYKLSENVESIALENLLLLKNPRLNYETKLSGLAVELFNELIKNGDTAVINRLENEFHEGRTENLKVLNSLVYNLLNGRFIESVNDYKTNDGTLFIKSCILEITNNCNFRCEHCYVEKRQSHFLSVEQIKAFVDELYSLNCNRILLSGGEVCTHPNFKEIYSYIYDLGFIVSINSNGSFLKGEILEFLKERPPFAVEISLYGDNEQNFDNFTKTNNNYLEQTIQNIKELQKSNINVVLKNVITNKNKAYFYKIKELAHSLNAKFRSDYFVFPSLTDIGTKNEQLISPQEAIEYLKAQKNIEAHFLDKFQNKDTSNLIFKCKKDDDSIFVDCNLNVSMCICMQQCSIPYNKGNLAQIILELQKIKTKEYDVNAKCKDCSLKPLCRYCPAKFYLMTKDYEKPHEWFCEFGNLVYKNFIEGNRFVEKKFLLQKELNRLFEITASNMAKIGFEIKDSDKQIWCESLKNNLHSKNFTLYNIYRNGEIVGFVSLESVENNLFLCDIELDENVQKTRLILDVIKFLNANQKFKDYPALFFGINKNNKKSLDTCFHLGAEIIEERPNAYRFKLNRVNIEKYLQRFK